MAHIKGWMADQEETARDILDDLILEIDVARAALKGSRT